MSESSSAASHEMKHGDSPTWCIHCGTFDIYCAVRSCTDERSGKYDSRKPASYRNIIEDTFGMPLEDVLRELSEAKTHD